MKLVALALVWNTIRLTIVIVNVFPTTELPGTST
jgi:hypothetical protein